MRDGYQVKLDQFEGPLDLLLHLIKKHEVDLYEIPVATITDQYLGYLRAAQELDLDVAGEYLVMAATLIYLKSRLLLPADEVEPEEEEEVLDTQADLVRQLLEYRRYQAVAEALAARPVLGRDVFPRPVASSAPGELLEPFRSLRLADLLQALERVIARRLNAPVHRVGEETLGLREGLGWVVGQLRLQPRTSFEELFPEDASRLRIIVTFLAVLELVRVGAVAAEQGETYGEIVVVLLRDVDADSVLELTEPGEHVMVPAPGGVAMPSEEFAADDLAAEAAAAVVENQTARDVDGGDDGSAPGGARGEGGGGLE